MADKQEHLEAITSEGKRPWASKIIAILLIVLLFVPGVAKLFNINSPNYSKEPLQPEPEWSSLNLATIPGAFDNWWKDNFPFRSVLVSGYNGLMDHVFQTSGNESVLVGQEGWYYYAETTRQAVNAHDLTVKDISRIANTLNIIKTQIESEGMSFQAFIIPNKATVYPEYLPNRFEPVNDESMLEQLYNELSWAPNMLEILESEKTAQKEVIYQEADSHWNRLGAYAAYETIVQSFDSNDETIDYGLAIVSDGWESDLTNMLYPLAEISDEQVVFAEYERAYIPLKPMQTYEDVDIVTMSSGSDKSLLLYRDSFANLLIDLLSNHYSSARYNRALPFHLEFAQDSDTYDYVGVEIVERNLDYLVQQTPILVVDNLTDAQMVAETAVDVELSNYSLTVNSGRAFINAEYADQTLGAEIEQVLVEVEGELYPAFTIYEDSEITDKTWTNGFSIYLDAASLGLDENSLHTEIIDSIYYAVDTAWYQAELDYAR